MLLMSEDQKISRSERVAIMVIDYGTTEEAAERFCDTDPAQYGIRDIQEVQEGFGFQDAYQYR